jgi:hypothetical protein
VTAATDSALADVDFAANAAAISSLCIIIITIIITIIIIIIFMCAGEVIVDGYLYANVVPDECNWQLGELCHM